ncbi:MAG: hypothetical protein GXY37_08735 [Chloroflexi bacterium]|nr:hypothetical protein [Chloroflexota bacterium]
MTEHRQRMALESQAVGYDKFEILAITAGAANGWEFQPEVLRDSLALWEGVNCFIDHNLGARSVRDIAGVLRKVSWDEAQQGIRAEIHAFGPSQELLKEIGRQVLEENGSPAVKVGFSADVLFRSKGKQVEEILRVYSVDLVYNPARGGVFLRALNQLGLSFGTQGGLRMQTCQEQEMVETAVEAQTSETAGAEQVELQTQLAEMRQMRAEMSGWMMDVLLGNSQLPAPVKERLRKQFNGRTFAPAELSLAIREAKSMLAELDPGRVVKGPARIEGMVDSTERVQAAVDDLFGAPREKHLLNVKVPRLSGIRELYLSLTGDIDLHGGYHPERAQLATTADFSGLVKNSLNKLVANTWEELGRAGYDWWKDISVQEHFNSLHDISGTLIGTVGDLPTVAEGAAYPELKVGDSPETARFTKYGGYIPLTLELIDRDETRKLRAYARELASAGMRKISRLVANIFTVNGGTGPTMMDGGNLFNLEAVTDSGGHGNLSVLALDQTNWDLVSARVYKQPMLVKLEAGLYGSGPMLAVNPKFLLVSRANQKAAMEICGGSFVREAGYVYDNVLKGSAVPVVVPDWTDDNDWAAVCDPRVAPAIFVGERFGIAPEIFIAGDELSPAVFTNDEHRLKVRHFLAVWVNDFRPLHKSNVA